MKLYKNGQIVFEMKDCFVDAIESYQELNLSKYDYMDFIKYATVNCGDTLRTAIYFYPFLLDATESDCVFIGYSGAAYFYPAKMQETDSHEAVNFWINVLRAEIDDSAEWEIEVG